jgi:hypothetical protein
MKTQIKSKTLLIVLSITMMLSILVGIMPLTARATETSPEWVADYTVTAGCGTAETTLGVFKKK